MKNKIKDIIIFIVGIVGVFISLAAVSGILSGELITGIIVLIIGILFIVPSIKVFDIYKRKKEIEFINSEKEAILAEKERQENEKNNILKALNAEIEIKNKDIIELKTLLDSYDKDIALKIIDTRDYSDISSTQIKNELSILELQIKELIKRGKAVNFSVSKNTKRINFLTTQILKVFNSDVDAAFNKLSHSNVDVIRGKMTKSFESTNKIFADDDVSITKDYLDLKFNELNLLHQYNIKIEAERDQQKAIKEQMLEEEKVRREIEREKRKIEKEETQFKNEQNKLLQYLNRASSDVERDIYLNKIKELEEKLALLEKDKENVLERETNTRAGYVYVISNIGSFGEDIYKIGMTRRLEPMDRVKELGNASVPFEFDVHAMIFSEDAPALEHTLHQHFRKNEVNKVNQRKEFFKVNLKDIEEVVKENHNAAVEFTELAKAEQYRESLRLSTEINN